ncbi:hypothetical protein ACTL6U_13050 [Rhodovibrionaceae bacterium A322]
MIALVVAVMGSVFAFISFARWRKGFVYLLWFITIAGGLSLMLRGTGLQLLGPLQKDFFFVLPLYMGFLMAGRDMLDRVEVPPVVLALFAGFTLLVILQCANPSVYSPMVAAIGVKVWLLYIPLIYVAGAYLDDKDALVKLMRIMMLTAILPCAIGLFQWFLAGILGLKGAISLFYSEAGAKAATQGFVAFDYGGTFYRIPSTFSFATQYFAFTLTMIVPAMIVMRSDPEAKWRFIGRLVLLLVVAASILSGSRSAFVFVPFLILAILVCDGSIRGSIGAIMLFPPVLIGVVNLAGFDLLNILGQVSKLGAHYGSSIAAGGPLEAMALYPFGVGTGMNTGAARYALGGSTALTGIVTFESYYAKAIVELGFLGLIFIAGIFAVLLLNGVGLRQRLRDPYLRGVAGAMIAFIGLIAVNSTKGWVLDIDPVNVYFWVFVGILFRLPGLDRQTSTAPSQTEVVRPVETHPFLRSLNRPPTVLGPRSHRH